MRKRHAGPVVLGLALLWFAGGLAACTAQSGSGARLEVGEDMPGGDTTNTLLLGANAFTRHVSNITPEHEGLFFAGNGFFNQPWVQAPASTAHRDGLGPLFNARSCAACHFKDGRGRPPLEPDEPFLGMLIRLSVDGEGPHGQPVPEPAYGGQLQPFAVRGVPAEGRPWVQYEEVHGEYADGEPYTLLSPTYGVDALAYGPLRQDVRLSPRVAPAVIGLGLLEAISTEDLETLEDPDDADGDGISGRLNRVWDARAEALVVGRFGWKAEQPSVRQQTAGALLGDMGITSGLFVEQDCVEGQIECRAAASGGEPEIEDRLLERLVTYTRLLAVPVRIAAQDATVLHGKQLFGELGCAACHVPHHRTGDSDLEELRDQDIWPYTDLLLHDMGEGLSDHRPSFAARGAEWRTPPLWGLGYYEAVNGHERLLHDGRARGVREAILWHGGEAEAARDGFVQLTAQQRDALVAFVRSL